VHRSLELEIAVEEIHERVEALLEPVVRCDAACGKVVIRDGVRG
jgi:hypothetical protein